MMLDGQMAVPPCRAAGGGPPNFFELHADRAPVARGGRATLLGAVATGRET